MKQKIDLKNQFLLRGTANQFHYLMAIKKYIFLSVMVNILNFSAYSQSKIVLNNDAYFVFSNGANLVVDNSNANAISLQGTGGNIISELETNNIRWSIGTSTGSYVIPFTKSSGNKIPLTFSITGAGVGGGSVLFSTYAGGTWNNDSYRPSDVTNMTSACCVNNSAFVIDRFWKVDAVNYTTKPSGTLTFSYLDAEYTAAGNTIAELNLRAQQFNTMISSWDPGPLGSINAATNQVSAVAVTSTKFFKSWTLADNSNPLPVELIYFHVNCNNKEVSLNWETASEANNDYFTIEKSADGMNWSVVTTIKGAGNSSTNISYTFTEETPSQVESYYRLKQTDFDGHAIYSAIISGGCSSTCLQQIKITSSESNPQIILSSGCSGDADFYIYNSIGQLLFKQHAFIDKGENKIALNGGSLSSGMYMVKIAKGNSSLQEKFIK